MKYLGQPQTSQVKHASASTRTYETAKEFRDKEAVTRAHKLVIKAIVSLLESIHKIDVTFHSFEFSIHQLADLLKDVEMIQSRRQMLLILKGVNNIEIKG